MKTVYERVCHNTTEQVCTKEEEEEEKDDHGHCESTEEKECGTVHKVQMYKETRKVCRKVMEKKCNSAKKVRHCKKRWGIFFFFF